MVVRKFAADPSVVDIVLGYLSDNPLTRSWDESVAGVVNAAERQIASDVDLRANTPDAIGRFAKSEGGLSEPVIRAMSKLKGGDLSAEELNEKMKELGVPVDEFAGGVAEGILESSYDRERAKRALEIAQMNNQVSEVGSSARVLAGHPAVAYSAVTAGGALGTKAAMELAAYLQAQQQAEKESQLEMS